MPYEEPSPADKLVNCSRDLSNAWKIASDCSTASEQALHSLAAEARCGEQTNDLLQAARTAMLQSAAALAGVAAHAQNFADVCRACANEILPPQS